MDKLTNLETKIDMIDGKLKQQTAEIKAFMTEIEYREITVGLKGIGDRYIAYKKTKTYARSLIEKWHGVIFNLNLLETYLQPGDGLNFFETQIEKSANYGSCLKLADTRLVHKSKYLQAT